MEDLLTTDIGFAIISLIELETLRKLYISFPFFYELLNKRKTLNDLCKQYRIISVTKSFPQYYVNYIIKYDPKNSPFNEKFITDVAIENDDVRGLKLIYSVRKMQRYASNYLLCEAVKHNKQNVLNYVIQCTHKKSRKAFMHGYSGTFWDENRDVPANISISRGHEYLFFEIAIIKGNYERALKFIQQKFDNLDISACLGIFWRHIMDYHSYEECIQLIKMYREIFNIPVETLRGYKRFCTCLIEKGKKDYIDRMISDGYITLKKVSKISKSLRHDITCIKFEMLEYLDYNMPQLEKGNLTNLTKPNSGRKKIYYDSIIDLIKGLHGHNKSFEVSQYVYEQIVQSKDVLSADYIIKNQLLQTEI